jgi:hypothetical protein
MQTLSSGVRTRPCVRPRQAFPAPRIRERRSRSPSRAKTKQRKEEGSGSCFAHPEPDDAAMRRFAAGRVSDGTRTRDRLDHNQELYLLSYAHQATVGM